jgi:hypothetical protein
MYSSPILFNTVLQVKPPLANKKQQDVHKLKKFSTTFQIEFTQRVQKELLLKNRFGPVLILIRRGKFSTKINKNLSRKCG